MRKISAALLGLVLAVALHVAPAHAQIPVTDVANLQQETLKLLAIIQQVQTAEQQLSQATALLGQAQSIYNAANKLTSINSVASALNDPLLRQFLPTDVSQLGNFVTNATSGQYSSLNGVAQGFAAANRILSPSAVSAPTDPGAAFLDQTLTSRGNAIASFMAQGQSIFQTATTRLAGLEQLRTQLDSAHDAKDTADLQTRIAAETAEINNDIMRMQGLQMIQKQQLASFDQQAKEAQAQRTANAVAIFQAGAPSAAASTAPNGS